MPDSAAAASAEVTPGTTSKATPAAFSAVISSCARPNSMGSPPLRRTTTRYFRAASIRRLLMNCCAVTKRPQRLPTAIRSARGARDSTAGLTRASCKTMSARFNTSAALTVRRSGAPGPAPTRYTLPSARFTGRTLLGLLGPDHGTPAEERHRALDGSRIGFAERAEPGQRLLRILALSQREGIEAAAGQVEQLVAEYVANGAQLSLPPVALAQQSRGGVATAIAELREVDRDHAKEPQV